MGSRLSTAASILSLAAAGVALGTLEACRSECPDGGWLAPRSIDLGISSDLHSVAPATRVDQGNSAIAVGSAGTVVAWGYLRSGELFVQTSTVADVELRGVTDAGGGRWLVVGDGGFAAVSDDSGQTWTTADLQTAADLHAVVTVGESVIVVGDEVVRTLEGDTWLEPPTPEGGWGQLRGIGSYYPAPYPSEDRRTFAVGLNGVILSTDDPSGAWVAEDSGVSVDLFAVGPLQWLVAAVGANGTLLIREAGEWRSVETKRTVDFVDYQDFVTSYGLLLTADGEVLRYRLSDGLESVDRIEGARGLVVPSGVLDGKVYPTRDGVITVGDAGLASSIDIAWCE